MGILDAASQRRPNLFSREPEMEMKPMSFANAREPEFPGGLVFGCEVQFTEVAVNPIEHFT